MLHLRSLAHNPVRQSRLLVALVASAIPLFLPNGAFAHSDAGFGFGLSSCNCYAPGSVVPADFVVGGSKWGASQVFGTAGGVVTYSFATGSGYAITEQGFTGTIVPLDPFMPANYRSEIARAFDAWEAVANIQFLEVPDNGVPFGSGLAVGNIRIGGHNFDGPFGVIAHAYYPTEGDIHFDTSETWTVGFAGSGIDIFQVAAHEIGHSIGLNHTGVANSLMNPSYSENFSGPQADDIAGARFMYGAAVVTVPEPGSVSLLCLGAVSVLGLARCRRKTA